MKSYQKYLMLLLLPCFVLANEVFVWIQYGDAANTLTKSNFDANPHIEEGLTAVALQYWNVASNGSLPYVSSENSSSDVTYWVDRAHSKGLDVYMTVTSIYGSNLDHVWNPYVKDALMTNRSACINNILDTVDHYGLDGVDIDLEATYRVGSTEGSNEMPLFLKALKDSLNQRGKKLSLCTFAGDNPSYYGNYPQVYDSKEWFGKVDYLNVMGYAETWEANTNNLSYSYIINQYTAKGFESNQVNIGLPAWVTTWGSPSEGPAAHIADVEALDGSICIWDSKLYNGGSAWTNSTVWSALKRIKDLGVTRYAINASAGIGGSITPTGVVDVDSATNQSFTISANQWYLIDDVKVDGSSVGAVSSYTFPTVTAPHTIAATFKADPGAPTLFTLTTSAGGNGAVSPLGAISVAEGTDTSLTVTPNSTYMVSSVLVDGVDRGPIVSATFKNMYANHTLAATFVAASGSDIGKYEDWNDTKAYFPGDTVAHVGKKWSPQWQPGIGVEPGNEGTQWPAWIDLGALNLTSDTLITAVLDYRSATNGSDTLIITTSTSISGGSPSNVIDTIILGVSPVSVAKAKAQQNFAVQMRGQDIQFTAPQAGNYTVHLFTVAGRQIVQKSLTLSAQQRATISTEAFGLSRGVYMLQIVSPKGLSTTQKMMVP